MFKNILVLATVVLSMSAIALAADDTTTSTNNMGTSNTDSGAPSHVVVKKSKKKKGKKGAHKGHKKGKKGASESTDTAPTPAEGGAAPSNP